MSEHPILVAFDLDDTLYLERAYVQSGFEAVGCYVREVWGLPGFAEQAWALFQQGVRGKVFDAALTRLGGETFIPRMAELVRAYREHVPSLALPPDSVEVLSFLRIRCHVAIISDGPLVSQRRKVEALGLRNLVKTIILTSEMGEKFSKPLPGAYREVEVRWGIRGRACAYIGDNPAKDFVGARALEWRTIRIRRPGGLHAGVEAAPDHEADCEVLDLREAIIRLGFHLTGV